MTVFMRIGALLLALCLSQPALGLDLKEAKNQLDTVKSEGYVGEQPTGYLGVVKSGKQAQAIVEVINHARREQYVRIAEKHNIPVAEVEVVAGKKAMEKTPPGQYVLVNGNWEKK